MVYHDTSFGNSLHGMRMPMNEQLIHCRDIAERSRGMFLGLAIGDALGLPVETLQRHEVAAKVGRITTYLPHTHNTLLKDGNHPLGLVSDDTQLSLAISAALREAGRIDLPSIAHHHMKAYDETTLGWGQSTREAVARLHRGAHWAYAGSTDYPDRGLGNGVAMKVGPIAVFLVSRGLTLTSQLARVCDVAELTHKTSIAVSSALAQVAAVMYCLTHTPQTFNRDEFIACVTRFSAEGRPRYPRTLKDDLTDRLATLHDAHTLSTEDIIQRYGGGSSYVYDSLPFSYAFFLRDFTRIDALYEVVNAGGDTDSNGSMVGALLGSLNGTALFPEPLVTGLSARSAVLTEAEALTQ